MQLNFNFQIVMIENIKSESNKISVKKQNHLHDLLSINKK